MNYFKPQEMLNKAVLLKNETKQQQKQMLKEERLGFKSRNIRPSYYMI